MQKIKFKDMTYGTQFRGGEKDNGQMLYFTTVQQQIDAELEAGKSKNSLKEITGKWPGEESLEELLKQIEE